MNWIDQEAIEAGWRPTETELARIGGGIVLDTITRKQIKRAKEALDVLTAEERLDIFFEYCRSCGSKGPKCQCWNDE